MPETHLAGAILVTLFCCLPFGIPAIVNAAKVTGAYDAGDYDQAVEYSEKANKWMIWSLVSGLIIGVVYAIIALSRMR